MSNDLSAHVPELVPADSPSQERGTDAPDVETGLRDAVASLQGPPFNAAVTFARSEAFWAAVEPLKRDVLARVQVDAGVDEDAPQTLLGLQDAYAEAHLFRRTLFLRLVDAGGPITNKGKCRALYTAYLAALDRETKLAQILGLERKARTVPRPTDWIAQPKESL